MEFVHIVRPPLLLRPGAVTMNSLARRFCPAEAALAITAYNKLFNVYIVQTLKLGAQSNGKREGDRKDSKCRTATDILTLNPTFSTKKSFNK